MTVDVKLPYIRLIRPQSEIIASKPDGIMLSNGPGDPADCTSIIEEIRKLYNTDIPIFAICLGHQLMALATGATTHKTEIRTPRRQPSGERTLRPEEYISPPQNHGYVVDEESC